jgi:Zn-dependent membrane protease YugP
VVRGAGGGGGGVGATPTESFCDLAIRAQRHPMATLSAADAAHPVLFGLKLYELLTLVGIVIGPIVAVVITLITERWRKTHDSQMRLLQALLTTRITPANDQWSMAVNMVPIEFRHHKEVIERWKDYVSIDDVESNGRRIVLKQNAMIHAAAVAMKIKITEGDLQDTAYYSKGSTDRDELVLKALSAFPQIAQSTARSAEVAEAILKKMN